MYMYMSFLLHTVLRLSDNQKNIINALGYHSDVAPRFRVWAMPTIKVYVTSTITKCKYTSIYTYARTVLMPTKNSDKEMCHNI